MHETIVVLDFGSPTAQLLARRVRESGVYCEIHPCTRPAEEIAALAPSGLILSGGPASGPEAPPLDPALLALERDGEPVPVLGVGSGMAALALALGGALAPSGRGGFGRARLEVVEEDGLLLDVPDGAEVWMSLGARLARLPEGFRVLARAEGLPVAALAADPLPGGQARPLYGVGFHPESPHTEHGRQVLENFALRICGCRGDWSPLAFIEAKTREVREAVGEAHVVLGLSGGVDSSVAAVLLHGALGERLTGIFVDTGLLRKGEREEVERTFREHFPLDLVVVDAAERFLGALAGVEDPEQKRKIIGRTFIEAFEEATGALAERLGRRPRFLAQGTLYSDVIESVSFRGPGVAVKSHHNVGGLPEELGFELLEPFRELFKDEVREVGRLLGVPEAILGRHPFPGPGLAVRILGAVTPEHTALLREADAIFTEELRAEGLYGEVWQAFVVLLPVKSVGVAEGGRTYENAAVLRAVTSVDGTAAEWAPLPHAFLGRVAERIIREVRGINRVAYDISSKPPATIEWE